MLGSLPARSQNFAFLATHEERLAVLGEQAERYFQLDPPACIIRLRQLSEAIAQEAAACAGQYTSSEDSQLDLLRRLRDARVINREVADLFHVIRKAGNLAAHENAGTPSDALHCLKLARQLAIWFHRTFGSDPRFKPGPLAPPKPPPDATAALNAQLELLKQKLRNTQSEAEAAKAAAEEAAFNQLTAEERAREREEEFSALEALMDEAAARESEMLARLSALQTKAAEAGPTQFELIVAKADEAGAALDLDEADTRGARLVRRAILAKAFRGELVAQDPSDEPAAALLERLRAEREAAAPKKRRRGKREKVTSA